MESMILKGGRIRPRVIFLKALVSAICISSGGSAGREGPIVQIGSATGSTIGQYFKMSDDRTRILVACGAAGGIAATFNAPLAGVIFSLELILLDFTLVSLIPVVISSVFAAVISDYFIGNATPFIVSDFSLVSFGEIPLYHLLGIGAGLISVAFILTLYRTEDIFNKLKVPKWIKPAVGFKRQQSILIIVVLLAPLGPSSEKSSPFFIPRSTPLTAVRSPNLFVIPKV